MVRSSSAPKREEVPMKFTTFHVPPVINTKNVSSTYLRSENQTIWARNVAANAQRKRTAEEAFTGKEKAPPTDGAPGSKTLVIHPGSRWLKIGMATDVFPVQVPNVIARRRRTGVPRELVFSNGVIKPASERNAPTSDVREKAGEYEMPAESEEDPFTERTAGIRSSLLARMKFYKLQALPHGSSDAARYNASVKPTTISEHNDASRAEWLGTSLNPIGNEQFFVGNKALLLGEPAESSFTLKWPLRGNSLNTCDYDSAQEIISDIETIWSTALLEELDIPRSRYKQELNVILVIPDHFDRFYVRELANVLLVQMGFAQICVQQESLCAAFGAGLSTACVVDIGAVKTSIACVDEGQVVPDTRITLDLGGDDITEYLYYLLKGINFPHKNCQLSETTDWNILTRLKKQMCSLSEVVTSSIQVSIDLTQAKSQTDVALNLYDFHVRKPDQDTEQHTMQVYDEPVVAAMCIFEPRIIDFDAKKARQKSLWTRENVEDVPDFSSDNLTQAMLISTQHLLPPQPVQTFPPKQSQQVPQVDGAHDADGDTEMDVPLQAEPSTETSESSSRSRIGDEKHDMEDEKRDDDEVPTRTARSEDAQADPSDLPAQDGQSGQPESIQRSPSPTQPPTATIDESTREDRAPSVEIIPELDATAKPPKSKSVASNSAPPPVPVQIDVRWEASKLPLDVAIFNSARAAGGVDRIKKFLQVVIIVGGTSMIPGMVHALESRLQAIAFPLVPGMEKVQVVPSPKDIDPRVLSWKGAAVLAKLEALNDMWITARDWHPPLEHVRLTPLHRHAWDERPAGANVVHVDQWPDVMSIME
ncbi:cytoskeleton organization, partial [Rhizoctonia solani]